MDKRKQKHIFDVEIENPFVMKRLLLSVKLLFFTAIVCAGNAFPPSVRIAEGPWLQQVGDRGFTVVWTTNVPAAAWVEVAPDDTTKSGAKRS